MKSDAKPCSGCGGARDRAGQAYCRDCHSKYMREWRQSHPLTEEERRKDICRSYTSVLIRRGHLQRGPCTRCGATPAQAHHPDYTQPRLVVWLCPSHHRAHHRELREKKE